MSIIYEKKDRVAYIVINRPEVNNAIDGKTNEKLYNVWSDFRDDPNCWVAVFSGAGEKSFSAGADLTNMENLRKSIDGGHSFGGITRNFETWKPIIAAVNGSAFGGGVEMMLACDIRIASHKAKFGLTEVKLGMIPGAGGTQRLIRNVPRCLAFEMLLLGKIIDAEEAYRIHLVNKIVPYEDLMTTATNLAKDICEVGPLAVRAGKEAMSRGLLMPLEEGLRLESLLVKILRETEDVKEGIKAFREKRNPVFKGM
jgi:enoyl-CoA hydratase/carnithine racemase